MNEKAATADLIVRNGRIYTVDANRSWVSAIAIRNGRVIAVGDDAAVEPHKAAETTIVDLEGRMTMPGNTLGRVALRFGILKIKLAVAVGSGSVQYWCE